MYNATNVNLDLLG